MSSEKVSLMQTTPFRTQVIGSSGTPIIVNNKSKLLNAQTPGLSASNGSLSKPSPIAAAAGSSTQPKVIEYSLRVPKTNVKPISMMRFNGALNVDINKWTGLKMQREDSGNKSQKSNFPEDDNMPKFGAGSEYGREAREEARRRKYTPTKKKINIQDQPWVLKATDKEKQTRKFRGVRDGGLTQHASYFIFTQAADGVFEAFPVQNWFNFTSVQKYKCLSAEEAEEEFGRRNKIMNYFSLMVSKRMQSDETPEEGAEKGGGKSGSRLKSSSTLKVSEMDDWEDSDDREDDSEPEEEGSDKKKKKFGASKKKKNKKSDDEGQEDSDDGDDEGRELDYISDSSISETEEEAQKKAAQKGVDQESGLDSDESSSDEEKKDSKEEEKEDEPGPSNKDEKANGDQKEKKKKKKKVKKAKKDGTENLSDDDEEDEKDEKPVDDVDSFIDPADSDSGASGHNSGDNSQEQSTDADYLSGMKRKASSDIFGNSTSSSKKAKMEMSSTMLQAAASDGITEDSVRRYLTRKPMTATELLQKFKSKKTKISSQDMVNVIAHLLKKINPVKRMQNQKMYLFLSSK